MSLEWCRKYLDWFRTVLEDEKLRNACLKYSVYALLDDNVELRKQFLKIFREAYDSGVVITEYYQVIEETKMSEADIAAPTKDWIDTLSDKQILAAIAWHFRRDHFNEGSLINNSVAKGHLLLLMQGYIDKASGMDN